MCGTCGCTPKTEHQHSDESKHEHSHGESHSHEPGHSHVHAGQGGSRLIEVRQSILSENDRLAAQIRHAFDHMGITCINIMSSPGSGKTTLLRKTLEALAQEIPMGVIVGDQKTEIDSERLRGTGAPVVQIETGELCHLDATHINGAVKKAITETTRLLFIENIGNLICPASFDLGEHARVALFSVTEGEEKPLKYPSLYSRVDLVVMTKVDLVPVLDFDMATAKRNIGQVCPSAKVIDVSAKSGQGLEEWYGFLRESTVDRSHHHHHHP